MAVDDVQANGDAQDANAGTGAQDSTQQSGNGLTSTGSLVPLWITLGVVGAVVAVFVAGIFIVRVRSKANADSSSYVMM